MSQVAGKRGAVSFRSLIEATPTRRLRLQNTTASWIAWAAAALARSQPVLLVVADDDVAASFESDLRYFCSPTCPVETLSSKAALNFMSTVPDRPSAVERMRALRQLGTKQPSCVIATVSALMKKTLPLTTWASRLTTITAGDTVDRDQLIADLIAWGWTRSPVVDEPGSFAVRGGVLDVFSPLDPYPIRIELFGDSVESLRSFDAESQRTLRSLQSVTLAPCNETAASPGVDVRAKLRQLADELTFPSKATRKVIDDVESGSPVFNLAPYLPAMHDELLAPCGQLSDWRWIVVAPDAVTRTAQQVYRDGERQVASNRDQGVLSYSIDSHLETPALWEAASAGTTSIEMPSLQLLASDDTNIAEHTLSIATTAELRAEIARSRGTHDEEISDILVRWLAGWRRDGMNVVVATDSQSRCDRLLGLLSSRNIKAAVAESFTDGVETKSEAIVVTRSAPSASFISRADTLVVLIAADIFGEKVAATVRRKNAGKREFFASINDFSQLSAGDYVVHQRHGVGRYRGLAVIPIGAVAGVTATHVEALHLEYDGGTLYLPVYRLGEVDRYIGAPGDGPRLDKLGGVTWLATRTKVSRQVQVLAEELLQLYAQRAAITGHPFPPADEQFSDFVASFPFQETPDQAAAIAAVMADMEQAKPMDRLVCGDVGYGKTEVALRAIFRCIAGGKQAVLLAPTTVLVEQHVRTITARLKDFPINIGKLSRFQSKREQADVVRQLAEGGIDVVVATHRVLSNDIRVKDLGLLVIDEEQRFGVAHKERLKKLRANVDVLTLTATPIPRTLHLAMAGLRDLSIIATPPTDRRAVRTLVARPDDDLIKDAISRELARDGQVFFITRNIEATRPSGQTRDLESGAVNVGVNPRQQGRESPLVHHDRSIESWKQHLQALVPNARIGVAHGQQSAETLEDTMLAFVRGDLDVLVSTTIVESGLDIPRANTMLVARADSFGLAQLYQLRGRIGRSSARAYCYLLVPSDEISDDARRRLDALLRFAELGAGFSIASQDLEIRGGGELLGAKQSGSIAAVGFDTYVRMLDQAVAHMRGEPIHDLVDTELSAELPGFLPEAYVPDPGQRLDLYKRLSSADSSDELRDVVDEIVDRFGPMPPDATLLCELMTLKAIARPLAAIAIEVTRTKVAIALPTASVWLAPAKTLGWKQTPDGRLVHPLPSPGGAAEGKRLLLALTARGTPTA
jgi:transcription-repair coupling factor (superfamily II helicase)